MDKISKYSEAILAFLNEYSKNKPANLPEVESKIIHDSVNHHFLLMRIGWDGNKYIHHCILHFDIINEKIWLQQNWTDVLVADRLIEFGISKDDIVLGFEPEFMRQYTGFAVA